ncbi:probable serine/threonine-protein kinase cdc7 [Eurosta solidaginis]|uniref:probable serine/threonine-protein kinase cdc7 n=1 Tax=Eurosta solidaginis TaxID=178769 RepID=UPI00353103F7
MFRYITSSQQYHMRRTKRKSVRVNSSQIVKAACRNFKQKNYYNNILLAWCLAFTAMVNDTIDITANISDFNFDSSATKKQNEPTVHHSPSDSVLKNQTTRKNQQKVYSTLANKNRQDHQHIISNLEVLPGNAANLSWTFFENVSKLDNQLHDEEKLSDHTKNGCHSASISPTSTDAPQIDNDTKYLMGHSNSNQKLSACKLNGFTTVTIITTTNNNKTELYDQILSQQSPDLKQKQQSATSNELQTETVATFRFTSPTATFKREKQQQKQLQQQLENQNQNNNNFSNEIEKAKFVNNSQPIEQQKQLNSNSPNRADIENTNVQQANVASTSILPKSVNVKATKTTNSTIDDGNSSIVASVSVGVATHFDNTVTSAIIANQHPTSRNRTLPRITTTTTIPHAAYAVDTLDIVGSRTNKATNFPLNGHDKRQRVTVKVKQAELQQHKQQQQIFIRRPLPKRMTTGAASTTNSAASGSGNSSNHSNSNNNNNSTLHKGGNNNANNIVYMDNLSAHLELVGWRKKCLYGLLVLLMLLIITNLVLTLWILKVMDFTLDGMGQLKIVPGGIQLTGQALIMDMLRASTIRSRHGQPIAIESSRNFSINTRDANGMLENHLFLGHDKLEFLAKEIRINDTNGRNLFSVNQNEVTIGAHTLRIDGEGGAIFRESIQTPHIRAEAGRELRLESPTRQLELTAAKDINLQSRAGAIEVNALKDVRLSALDGSLRLESSKILMPNLRTAQPPALGAPQSREHLHRVFQLCACSNGKLFLASPHSICAGDDSTVCR